MTVFLAICFSPSIFAALTILSMYITDSGNGD
jgi:hypothetical protein